MRTVTMNAFRKHPDGKLEYFACYQISEDLAAGRIAKEFPGTFGVLVWKFAYRHDCERLAGNRHSDQSTTAGPVCDTTPGVKP